MTNDGNIKKLLRNLVEQEGGQDDDVTIMVRDLEITIKRKPQRPPVQDPDENNPQ